MNARLTAVCSLLRPCRLLADIGCDHGYVARYALDNGVENVVASDVSAGSLMKARKLLAPYGSRARLVCADGLTALETDPDTIVIAGMGGMLICDILREYAGRAALVLGPQKDVPAVRRFLTAKGYRITDDFVAADRKRFYDVLRAERGTAQPTELQIRYGMFYRDKNEALRAKCEREAELKKRYGADIGELTEVLLWQQR